MAGCSPVYWKCGEHRHSMTGESTSPSTICPRTYSFSVCTKCDLPRPASPMSNTTWPIPSFACSQRSIRRLTSVSRPVNGATRVITDFSSSTAPLDSGTGPEGDGFENLDDSFPSSVISMPMRLQSRKPDFERARRCRNRLWHLYPGVSTKAQSRLLTLREGEGGRSEHTRPERHFRDRWMSCRDGRP